MLWIALAAAAQLSAPVPANLEKWFSYEDVPNSLVQGASGIWSVGIRVNVAPDGSIENCEVEKSSGIDDLDKLTCATVLRRAKLTPARSVEGSATYGAYRDSVSFFVGDGPPEAIPPSNPDLDVFVQAVPAGIKSPVSVRVMFAVDQTGNKSSCAVESGPSLEKTSDNPVLVNVACQQVETSYRATPAKDESGKPVDSVQDALVRFSVKRQ